jgi:penicillin-insensitive murein endopeptidase
MYGSVAVVTALSVALTCAAVVKGAARVPLPPSNPLKNTEQEKKQNSKPAMDLFSQMKLPSLGNAVAIGYYPRGCLQGGVELPTTGPNWQVMRVSRNRNWGHPELVQFLERFAPLAAEATGWKGILTGIWRSRAAVRFRSDIEVIKSARCRHLVHADAGSGLGYRRT